MVVDNSSFWRMYDDVPLVVSEVNPGALDGHKGIVANPNCSTMQMVVALKPILDAAGIERLVVSTYQSVSGTGQRAVEELHDQAQAVIEAKELPAPTVYPHQIAFNALPQVETFKDGDDYTTEERKMMAETRKILGADELGISATCVRIPVYTGHSESVNVQTREPLSPDECRELLSVAPGIRVIDDPANGLYPTAIDAAGQDDVLVGRIRRDPSHDRCLNLWVVGDNLRKGAATNAVQVAELLNVRGLLRPRSCACLASRQTGLGRAGAVRAREPGQIAPRGDAELAVDVARVGAHGLEADRQRLGDLRVGGAVLQQLEHVGLAGGEQVGALQRQAVRAASGGRRARQHVHAARGEVDRVDHVASLGLLGQARGGPEGEHLVALRRRGPVGQHHEAGLREAPGAAGTPARRW